MQRRIETFTTEQSSSVPTLLQTIGYIYFRKGRTFSRFMVGLLIFLSSLHILTYFDVLITNMKNEFALIFTMLFVISASNYVSIPSFKKKQTSDLFKSWIRCVIISNLFISLERNRFFYLSRLFSGNLIFIY